MVEDPNDPDSQAGIQNSKFKIPDGLETARLSSFQISSFSILDLLQFGKSVDRRQI